MNRAQFLEQLSRLLSDIPEAERREALDYYSSYFDDAGPENEGKVIQELGSPGKVAAIIKADLQENGSSFGEFTENGYKDSRTEPDGEMPVEYESTPEEEKERRRQRGERWRNYTRGDNKSRLILAVILLIFLAPIIKGVLGGAAGVLVTLILLSFLLAFGAGACALGLLIAGICVVGAGIGICVTNPAVGILLIGIGFLLLTVGALFAIATVWMGGKAVPWFVRKVTDFLDRFLHKRKGGKRYEEI
ncbi:MAG: DUF1700 domain-containing protein [Eubacteriales bacterium]|nr:DUF1700 domain-containing protein [Eubacteriales bacterium]